MSRPAPAPGDRVTVESVRRRLPTRGRPYGPPESGTVVDVDDRGVRVVLDHPVNGALTCYATHAECARIEGDTP